MAPAPVSCIIPVFNGERYLSEAVDSILAQSYRPLEIIIIDDGSTDGTASVAGRYGKQIHYVWQPNRGETSARNRGIGIAGGTLVAFLDADDLWHPEKLSRQMARFQERPELDLCFTRFQNFWAPELAEEQNRYRGHALSRPVSAYSIGTLLVRLNAFEKFGMFVEDGSRTAQNIIWFLQAAEKGAAIEVLSDVLMHRRFHSENRSRRHGLDNLFPILKAWRDYRRGRAQG